MAISLNVEAAADALGLKGNARVVFKPRPGNGVIVRGGISLNLKSEKPSA